MSEIDILYPEGKTVVASGESITVKPLKFGQIPKASLLLRPVVGKVAAAFSEGTAVASWVDVLADGGEELLLAMAWAINKPRDWFDEVSVDEGVELARALYEVNADFFTKKVMPLFAQLPAKQDGGTLLEPSSQAGIDAQT